MMNKKKKMILVIGLVGVVIIGLTFGGLWAVSAYLDQQYASLHDGCYPNKPNHTIVVKDDKATPSTEVANRCDTLTVTNLDDESREMAFGVHDKHTAYDGITEEILTKGQSFTVTLVQTGSFKVHDHEHDEVQAVFQVK
ncbi:MAG TPA: hypothetical protein VIM37_00995 [Candidatus Microsaccharimonas sp.]